MSLLHLAVPAGLELTELVVQSLGLRVAVGILDGAHVEGVLRQRRWNVWVRLVALGCVHPRVDRQGVIATEALRGRRDRAIGTARSDPNIRRWHLGLLGAVIGLLAILLVGVIVLRTLCGGQTRGREVPVWSLSPEGLLWVGGWPALLRGRWGHREVNWFLLLDDPSFLTQALEDLEDLVLVLVDLVLFGTQDRERVHPMFAVGEEAHVLVTHARDFRQDTQELLTTKVVGVEVQHVGVVLFLWLVRWRRRGLGLGWRLGWRGLWG